MRKRAWLSLAALSLVMLIPAACGTPSLSPSPSPRSGVQGQLLDVQSAQSSEPMAGFPLSIREGGFDGLVVAELRTDSLGKFAADLGPGQYIVEPSVTTNEGAWIQRFAVAPGRYTRVRLVACIP